MSRPLGFYVPYHEDDGADGSYAKTLNIQQFIPLSAIETIFQVNGGSWIIRTLSGNEYSCGYDEEGYPETIVIEELIGVADMEEMKEFAKKNKRMSNDR